MNEFKPLVARNTDGTLRAVTLARTSAAVPDCPHDGAEEWLRSHFAGPIEVRKLSEPASGWILQRQTIDSAIAQIAAGDVDVVVIHELHAIYRNPALLWQFIHACIDARVRLIACEDHVDTANDDWEATAHFGITRHGLLTG